jgi:uncharacterized radical SAM protein YgiQ
VSNDTLKFLPISREDLDERGWDCVDVVLVSGDAYVDHPSFGHAVIGRLLEHEGLRVAILPQPNWRDDLRDFKKLGKPRLFFGVTSGVMDSMVNHYTANRRLRSDDAYTPGGKSGFRPDRAATVYCNILKQLYPDVPIVLGGIEASLRRVSHYDYWSDEVEPSILVDSQADLLVYGMGEKPLIEIVRLLKKGIPFAQLNTVPQTATLLPADAVLTKSNKWEDVVLASHEQCAADPKVSMRNFRVVETESNKVQARRILQPVGAQTVVINPPYPPLAMGELDASFDLPYMRAPHPRYRKRGPVPAFEMIKFSVNSHRGCFGGCSFCTISAHQGKFIASRSPASILREIDAVAAMPGFAGTLSDLGGPSANMYNMAGKDKQRCSTCERPSCIFPKVCSNLDTRHQPLLDLYRAVRAHPQVKHLFIGSGLRYDLFMHETQDKALQKDHDTYFEELVRYHVGGRLKVAPEHTSEKVLQIMRKPSFALFEKFNAQFRAICDKLDLKYQIIPYFISSHPGSELADMAELALVTKQMGYRLEQVQDFTPTPLTLSTEMYYSGVMPITLKPVFVARSADEKLNQRRFFFWYQPENRPWIKRVLEDLRMGKVQRLLLSREAKEEHAAIPHRPKAQTPATVATAASRRYSAPRRKGRA